MRARDFTESDISLALDGELPAEDRTDYLSWLESRPDMKARSLRFEDDRRRLTEALDGVIGEPVPTRMTRLLETGRPPRRLPTASRTVAAALLFVAGLAGGYGLSVSWRGQPADRLLAEEAIAAHRIFSAEKRHVVEVGADEEAHLVGWLSKRVGVDLLAPDLTARGFRLMGGRLLPASSSVAAQFMYENPAGERVSLYVVQDETGGDTGFRSVASRGTRALVWLDHGYGCVVAGDLPEDRLAAVGADAYKQLQDGAKS